jgi:hypothetical protein
LLTPAGQVKILDFGLARFASERRPAGPLTQSGQMVGTPDYMAPEQALDARRADIRADIYSLGCTLYHLLSGRLPFPEGTPFQKLMAHQERLPVSLTKVRPEVPAELVRVVERMLAKDPAQRYQTPAKVACALAPFTSPGNMLSRPATTEEKGTIPRRRWSMIAAAVALFAVAGLLGIIIYIKTKKAEITIQSDDSNLKVNIKKDGEEVEIASAQPQKQGTQPSPSAGTIPPIAAPSLLNARTEVRLSEPFAQVRTGGAGRYLIFYLKKAKKLAVFDATKLRVVKEIDLPDDDLLYTAGLDKLMLVLRGQKMLQRWDLQTFQREKMVPLAEGPPVRIAVMGCSSKGPLLLHSNKEVQLWDIERLEPLQIEGKVLSGDAGAGFTVRASTDGQAFVAWHAGASPNQFPLMRLDGRKATIVVSPDAQSYYGAWAQPNADASLVFRYGAGIYTGDMKIISADAFKDSALLATEDPRFFLALRPQSGDKTQVSICTSCDRRAVYTVEGLEKLPGTVLQPAWGFWEGEPLVHYLPSAKLLITLPIGNDRVVVRYFDLLEALDKSGKDYLFVASQPKTSVATATTYSYKLDVKSKAGGVTYKLETGPQGMTVSKDGVLRWVVPPRQEGTEHKVVVIVGNKTGKEVIHAFDLEVVSNPAGP